MMSLHTPKWIDNSRYDDYASACLQIPSFCLATTTFLTHCQIKKLKIVIEYFSIVWIPDYFVLLKYLIMLFCFKFMTFIETLF
jgi:hypothetical protein